MVNAAVTEVLVQLFLFSKDKFHTCDLFLIYLISKINDLIFKYLSEPHNRTLFELSIELNSSVNQLQKKHNLTYR